MAEDEGFTQILARLAPGAPLREAIDAICQLGHGALILIADEEQAQQVVQSGFKIDAEFTPQKLTELSKMDRALVLDRNLRRILYANAYLVPRPDIPTQETGTRHLTAERVAKQLKAPAIAVSASKSRVTVYYGPQVYILPDLATISAKVNQALRILEQYRATFDELLRELTALEFEGRVLPDHLANCIQSIVQMLDVEEAARRWFVELGEERQLHQLLLDWLMVDVRESFELILRDYQQNRKRVQTLIQEIRALKPDQLLSSEAILKVLGYEWHEEELDTALVPRGYRVLSEIPRIPMPVIERVVQEFGSLERILQADEEALMQIKGIAAVRARAIRAGLLRLRTMFTHAEH